MCPATELAPGEMILVPLGTNGFVPSFGRHTMSFLLRVDDRAILLDAGTGVSRLLEPEVRRHLAGVEALSIVLSHYHLDHVIGLSYLSAVWRHRPVTIYGPAPPLVDVGLREATGQLVAPPLFPVTIDEAPMPVELVEYDSDHLDVDGLRFALRRQRHGGGSVGMVIEGRLAYLTDCEMEEAAADFARGVDLLVHEMWVTDAEVAAGASRRGHSTVEEVVRFAELAAVRRLMPVHHLPTRDGDGLRKVLDGCAKATGGTELVPPVEMRSVSLDG